MYPIVKARASLDRFALVNPPKFFLLYETAVGVDRHAAPAAIACVQIGDHARFDIGDDA